MPPLRFYQSLLEIQISNSKMLCTFLCWDDLVKLCDYFFVMFIIQLDVSPPVQPRSSLHSILSLIAIQRMTNLLIEK